MSLRAGLIFIFFLTSLALAGLAFEREGQAAKTQVFRFSVYGIGSFSNPIIASSSFISETALLDYGGGVGFGFRLSNIMELEFDIFYYRKKYQFLNVALMTTVTHRETTLHVPLIAKFHVGRVITLGAGGYWEAPYKKVLVDSSTRTSYGDLGLGTMGFGLLGTVGMNMPVSDSVGFIFEGRFLIGLTDWNDSATAANSWKYSEFMAVAGFSFGGSRRR